ncbi:cation transporter [Kistimonas asteriae]|uniref:cation transporter n=1 Tax=Kistimonas asteriae TaxID=517724 RepID=UPI001BABD3D7|nr:cation transporter [Kistimonas asteriae]
MNAERKALILSAVIALALAVWGIGMGVYSGSDAIMLDGSFNLLSAAMAFIGMKVAGLTECGYTRRYPLGFFAYEPLMVMVKGISVLVLVALALSSNIQVLLAGGRDPQLGLMLVYVGPAVAGCLLAWRVCSRANQKQSSGLLVAEKQAWLINTVISGSIGMALLIVVAIQGTSLGWVARYTDQILVIGFCLAFLRDPWLLVRNGFRELLLSAPDSAYIHPLRERLAAMTLDPHFSVSDLMVLKTGRRTWVSITVTGACEDMPLRQFFNIRTTIQHCAEQCYSNCSCEVVLERAEETVATTP